jgi:lipid-binding SYLF domain-containing protein
MHRRNFIIKTGVLSISALAIAGCSTSATTTVTSKSEKRHREINASIEPVLQRLHNTVPDSRELIAKANGVLVFPSVIAAGFGIGGQYGEGALRLHGVPVDYYRLTSVSVGLQIGAQSKAIILLFMTQEALNSFRSSHGWSAGADASVAVLKIGANGMIDANSMTGPVLAFVLTNAGLMANLTLEGTKISLLTD